MKVNTATIKLITANVYRIKKNPCILIHHIFKKSIRKWIYQALLLSSCPSIKYIKFHNLISYTRIMKLATNFIIYCAALYKEMVTDS